MEPTIWLRNGEETWIALATDDKGSLCVFSIAARANLLVETLRLGEIGAKEGITIEDVRGIYGSSAGDSEGSAVLVSGTAKPAPSSTSGLSVGVPEKLLQDLTEYLAEKKAKRNAKKLVCLSSVNQSIWDTLERQEGLRMIFKNIGSNSKRLSGLPAFCWDENQDISQADRYIAQLNKIKSGQTWQLIDAANEHPTLLSGYFGGWHFKGTRDVVFVHRIVMKTDPQRGLKCILKLRFRLKKVL